MARKCFYSFHFDNDNWRAAKVRNIGKLEGNQVVSDNKWEEIKQGGNQAIQNWIDAQMNGKSCLILLIGSATAGRKWIKYEIKKAWEDGKGVLGIHIHRILDVNNRASSKGVNPLSDFSLDGKPLTSIVNTYDPPFSDSSDVYNFISKNIESWVETAIQIRNKY